MNKPSHNFSSLASGLAHTVYLSIDMIHLINTQLAIYHSAIKSNKIVVGLGEISGNSTFGITSPINDLWSLTATKRR